MDSNYWIYWLDARLPEHKQVSRVMRKVIREEILMSFVTTVEIGHYLRMLPQREFDERMDMMLNLSTLTFVDLDDVIARQALDLLPHYSHKGLGGRDCVVVATMKASGSKEIYTHDHAFAQVEGIHVNDVL